MERNFEFLSGQFYRYRNLTRLVSALFLHGGNGAPDEVIYNILTDAPLSWCCQFKMVRGVPN